jgi:hypothetical protein
MYGGKSEFVETRTNEIDVPGELSNLIDDFSDWLGTLGNLWSSPTELFSHGIRQRLAGGLMYPGTSYQVITDYYVGYTANLDMTSILNLAQVVHGGIFDGNMAYGTFAHPLKSPPVLNGKSEATVNSSQYLIAGLANAGALGNYSAIGCRTTRALRKFDYVTMEVANAKKLDGSIIRIVKYLETGTVNAGEVKTFYLPSRTDLPFITEATDGNRYCIDTINIEYVAAGNFEEALYKYYGATALKQQIVVFPVDNDWDNV